MGGQGGGMATPWAKVLRTGECTKMNYKYIRGRLGGAHIFLICLKITPLKTNQKFFFSS